MARRDLTPMEQACYDILLTRINRLPITNYQKCEMIEEVDDLVDEIIKSENNGGNSDEQRV